MKRIACLITALVLLLAGCSERDPSDPSERQSLNEIPEEVSAESARESSSSEITAASLTLPAEEEIIQNNGVGGQVRPDDLKGQDLELYVTEGFTQNLSQGSVTSHSCWMVTEEALSGQIVSLCEKIWHYREVDMFADVLYGLPSEAEYYPSIVLASEKAVYRIHIINWEGEKYTDDFPIYRELKGKAAFIVSRYKRSEVPEGEPVFSFSFPARDTLNSPTGRGWFSIYYEKQLLDELLELLGSVGPGNAEEVARYE